MKKNLFVVAAVALLAFTACNKEEFNASVDAQAGTVEFVAGFDVDTKTTLDDTKTKTLWAEDDKISINGFVFKVSELIDGGISAKFVNEDDLEDFGAPFTACYPANVTEIPAVQTAYANNFDPTAVIEMAESDDHNLSFKNVASLLKFQVSASCKTVTFTSDDVLAGTNSKSVTISGSFVSGMDYYVAVKPEIKSNLVVKIDGYHSKTSKSSVNLERSKIMNLGKLPNKTTTNWKILGGYNSWNWNDGTQMYDEGLVVAKNVKLSESGGRGFKFSYNNWNGQIGAYGSDNNKANHKAPVNDWYGSEYNNNNYKADFCLDAYSTEYDVYIDVESSDVYFTPAGSPAPSVWYLNGINGDWSGTAMVGENKCFALRNVKVNSKCAFKFTSKNGTWIGGGSYTLGTYASASTTGGDISIEKGTYNIFLNSDRNKFMVEKIAD